MTRDSNLTPKAVTAAVDGAVRGVAASFLSGAALNTVPVTILWGLIKVGTATVVSWPVVAAFAAVSAAAHAVRAVASHCIEEERVNRSLDDLLE